MKKNIILLFAFLLTSCTCSSEYEEVEKMQKNAKFLKTFIAEQTYPQNSLLVESDLAGMINSQDELCIVYLVNSECSSCIGDYIRFLQVADCMEMDIHIYGIVNQDQEYVVDYFLDEYQVSNLKNIMVSHIPSKKMFPYGNHSLKNIFIVEKGVVMKNIGFNNGIFHSNE